MTRLACAIYTRKSSEEGLEKEFNSLDAQREACEAYVLSQKHAGWVAVRDLYDDGGLSGGTMERPALLRLLADIKSGKVQIVVVYKVDRLTRSLADFSKIVDVFDAHGASFVSVTQQFNTTTSMGRLTLNMLLSFAQFEREIAGERIRDKIAASKAKGMWMGGTVPLGYDVRERKLIVNGAEAETVRLIFRRYAELGSVTLLQKDLDRQGIRSKHRDGSGGRPFMRGALYALLKNRTYRGEVEHKDNVYPGQHEAIVDPALWSVVQDSLAANRRAQSLGLGAEAPSLLSGLIFDGDGNRMTPTHANKRGRRYRYYISESLLGRGTQGPNTMRVPAREVEGLVLDRLRALLASNVAVAEILAPLDLDARELERILKQADATARKWTSTAPEAVRELVRAILLRVTLGPNQIDVTLRIAQLALAIGASAKIDSGSDTTVDLSITAALKRCGRGKRIVIGDAPRTSINPDLVRVLREAFATRQLLLAPTAETINAITARLATSKGRLTYLMRLSYLAPALVDAILDGRQPAGLIPATELFDSCCRFAIPLRVRV